MQHNTMPFFPDSASTIAPEIDGLMIAELLFSVFFSVLIFAIVVYFALKYKRKSEDDRPVHIHGSLVLEIAWSLIPFIMILGFFVVGTRVFFRAYTVEAANTMEIFVTGKQWMWKIQHPEGPREINEMHLPVNRQVKFTMIAEDVIHSYFIPAFRLKKDVIPGRYTSFVVTPTKVGKYHLFCAEYCGTQHSGMVGSVYVMEESDYEKWVAGGDESMTARGEALFGQYGCSTCHLPNGKGRGPSLIGVYNSMQKLQTGGSVKADESYLRESILNPRAKVVEGFQAVMPTFQGQISEEGLLQVIAYIKSLEKEEGQ
ncbi:MAG: cytochrome c oxidase subunit II [Candidatus Solibacter usitatus]|nr:cytochrome c oxidase subunit II [Candidatus Solibacter usitatus]